RNVASREEQDCRVVYLGEKQGGRAEIGLRFKTAAPQFWGLEHPPSDWCSLLKYTVGDHVKVRLYSGETVFGIVRAVANKVEGTKLQIEFGSRSALVSVEQVIEKV